jgi:signal transduction histidine kinase
MIAAIIVPSVLLAALTTFQAYKNERTSVAEKLLGTVRAIAGIVDGEIGESDHLLKTLAASHSIATGDLQGVNDIARGALAGDERWFVLLDPKGRQLVNTFVPLGANLPSVELIPDFTKSMEAGKTFVSDLRLAPVANGSIVHISRPFFQDGKYKYSLNLVIRPSTLAKLFNVAWYASGSILTIADHQGIVIARTPSAEKFVGKSVTPDMVRVVQQHREGIGESVTLEGIPVITAYAPTKSGWMVLMGTPKTQLYASARHLLYIGGACTALLALIGVAMAAWISRGLVRSMDQLTGQAIVIGEGRMPESTATGLKEPDFVAAAMHRTAETLFRRTRALEELNRVNAGLVTEKTKAEAELRAAQHELEQKVEERTTSLREAVAQMEEFSYTVSHDLRSPLRAMSGFAEALAQDYDASLDETGREYVSRIRRAAERMDRLTTDLLTYSRIARAEVQRIPTDVEKIVRSMLETYPDLQPPRADVHLETPFPLVLAHESSLTQALANLLTNATKFVRPGERPEITSRAESRGNRVRIWVEDKGIGIPPAFQSSLFKMFERGPAHQSYEGTGVGLAIVRKAVEKMGGACGVESDGKSGSRFWIELDGV